MIRILLVQSRTVDIVLQLEKIAVSTDGICSQLVESLPKRHQAMNVKLAKPHARNIKWPVMTNNTSKHAVEPVQMPEVLERSPPSVSTELVLHAD